MQTQNIAPGREDAIWSGPALVRNRERLVVGGIFLAALAARLAAANWAPDLDSAGLYLRRAQELLAQLPWTGVVPTYWIHPPGVSILVIPALLLQLGYKGAQATIAILSATAVPGLWLVARNAGLSRRAAGMWAFVLCFSPAFFFSGAQVVPDVPLVAAAIWMIWAVQRRSIWLAVVLGIIAALLKEEGLALSTMGFISAIMNRDGGGAQTRKWLLPIALASLTLIAWWSAVGLTYGYNTTSQHIQEFSFTVHQLTHPLALLKRFTLVSFQALILVAVGSACVPFASNVFSGVQSKTRVWLRSNAASIAAVSIGVVLLSWHSIAGRDVLTRYMLPAAALFMGASAATRSGQLNSFGRKVNTAAATVCALMTLTWLAVDLRFIGRVPSVVTLSDQDSRREFQLSGSRLSADKPIHAILSFRQAMVSSKVYTDTYVLREVERIARDRRLLFTGTAAWFATQVTVAMKLGPLPFTVDNERKTALLLNDFTASRCSLAIARIVTDPAESGKLRTTVIRVGSSTSYIVETSLRIPECRISDEALKNSASLLNSLTQDHRPE